MKKNEICFIVQLTYQCHKSVSSSFSMRHFCSTH